MPIRPENRARYPEDWPQRTARIRLRAGDRCECEGECGRTDMHPGRCPNVHGQGAYRTGSRVVLTTAHLDHTPENCDEANLRSLCQGCHLSYDRQHHKETAYRTRKTNARTHDMFTSLIEGSP